MVHSSEEARSFGYPAGQERPMLTMLVEIGPRVLTRLPDLPVHCYVQDPPRRRRLPVQVRQMVFEICFAVCRLRRGGRADRFYLEQHR